MPDTAAPARTWRDGPIYWWIVAGLIAATAAVLGLWVMADRTVRHDVTDLPITEVGAIVFNCEPGHRVGAQVWLIPDNGALSREPIEGRACFDFSTWRWYLRDRAQFVPFGK